MKKVKILISAVFLLTSVSLLVFSPDIMVSSNGDTPMGTFVSWFAVISYALFWYYILPDFTNARFFRYLRKVKDIHFLLSLFWGAISALLAGNWQFTFHNRPIQFEIWMIFTCFLVVGPLLVLIILGVRRFICKDK